MKEIGSKCTPWRAALAAAPVHTPPRILVAEDDDAMRSVLVQTLAKDGYDISEVTDGGRLLVMLAKEYLCVDGRDLVSRLPSSHPIEMSELC
jgi:CheY-like chemotaxis protein